MVNLPLSARMRGLLLLVLLALMTVAAVMLSHTLLPFFIAFALVYLLNPIVTWLAKVQVGPRRLGRGGGLVIVYAAFALTVWFAGLFVLPQLYQEFVKLAQVLPKEIMNFEQHVLPDLVIQYQGYLDSYNVPFDLKKSLQDGMTSFVQGLQDQMGDFTKRLRDLVAGVFSAVLTLVLVFMLTTFLLLDVPRFKAWCAALVPAEYREPITSLAADIDRGLAGAVRGQIGVCLVNGVLTAVGLMVLKVKFAVTLGVVAGIFSLIPIFGTLISTIPAVLVGLTQSWVTALLVLAWILLIHLIEANVLNPKIIGHNAELHPVLVVLALVIGEHYGGVPGVLVAVPLATVVRSLVTYTFGRLLMPEGGPKEPPSGVSAEAVTPAAEPAERPAAPIEAAPSQG